MIDLLSNLPSLIQAIPSIMTGMKGKSTKKQSQYSDEIAGLSRAQYDQSSPIFQNLYSQERSAGQQDLASTISEISKQNRKAVTMGRTPLLDRERGGESLFRQLMMGQQDVGERARKNTFSQLGQAQGAMQGTLKNYDDLATNNYDNDIRKALSYYTVGDTLKEMFGLKQDDGFDLGNGYKISKAPQRTVL